MSFAILRNFNVDTFATLATISVPQEGDKAYLEDINFWFVFNASGWVPLGTFGDSIALSSGDTEVVIPLPFTMPSVDYQTVATLSNTLDLEPQLQPLVAMEKTISSFKVRWNSPVDSSGYRVDFSLIP